MKEPKPIELFSEWNSGDEENPGPQKALQVLYSDGLQQYADWLGDYFFPFFGINDFGLAKALPTPPSGITSAQKQYFDAANDFAEKINFLNTEIFDKTRINGTRLSSGTWPGDNLQVFNYEYYRNEVVPVFINIIEDLKVIQENILISAMVQDPDLLDDLFSFGTVPDDNIHEMIDKVLDSAERFFNLFPDISVSLKKDIAPLPDSDGFGPTPIFSDANLEASLGPARTGQMHYIGLLLDPEKSDGERSRPYLPVRLAPNCSEENLPLGWADPNYSIIRWESGEDAGALGDDGDLVKPEVKNTNGIEVPLGLEITITEIVPSETGVWVGFISDDARLGSGDFPGSNSITNGQRRVLYTESKYVRIREEFINTNPDPYISEKAIIGVSDTAVVDNIKEVKKIKGAKIVDPLDNQNWVKLKYNEVALSYYSFFEHNKKFLGSDDADNLFYNINTITQADSLRYSEGYFYFIAGAVPRKSEADIINESEEDIEEDQDKLNQQKSEAGSISVETLKKEAWDNLLNYLGKNTEQGNQNLYRSLYDKYFVLVDKKLNTNSTNPNNQKALFAIRTSYIDSLPDVKRPIAEDFKSDSPYRSGKNYTVTLKTNQIKQRVEEIEKVFKKVKERIESSTSTIENANGLSFDMDLQLDLIKKIPAAFSDFFSRQSWPNSTNRSFIDSLIPACEDSDDEHLIQVGIKDNKEVGGSARETISYVLFSPDPNKLKSSDTQNSDLLYLDPFLTDDELKNTANIKRSAVPLRIGLPVLRDHLEGTYGSRALHLFLAYDKIKDQYISGKSNLEEEWMNFLSSYMVPPVRIYLSKDPSEIQDPEILDCEELIRKLNKSGPVVGLEEKMLQEKLYNNPKCMEVYFNQYNQDTASTSPGLTKKEIENKSLELGEAAAKSTELEYLKLLYDTFFNVLDIESLISLILLCLGKQLGIQLTAEALCEAAIIALVERVGADEVEKVMWANALLSPESEAAQKWRVVMKDAPPFAPGYQNDASGGLELDARYNGAPIASALAASMGTIIRNHTGGPLNYEIYANGHSKIITIPVGGTYALKAGESTTPMATSTSSPSESSSSKNKNVFLTEGMTLKNQTGAPLNYEILLDNGESKTVKIDPGDQYVLQTGESTYFHSNNGHSRNKNVKIINAIRDLENSGKHIQLIPASKGPSHTISVPGETYDINIGGFYTDLEIENEKRRLYNLGYSEQEARARMLTSGHLRLDPNQYEPLLSSDDIAPSITKASIDLKTKSGAASYHTSGAAEDLRVVGQTAENWLSYMKNNLGLVEICELIVGDVLDGLLELIKDPGAFFSGGAKGWAEDFVARLKKQLIPPLPKVKFPDNLRTDSHMGNYEEMLAKMIIGMVAMLLGQIVHIILRQVLEKCLEENDDIGPAGRPPNKPPGIPLASLERADLPKINGLEAPDVVAWLKALIDTPLKTAQLCALLNGNATTQTLQDCLEYTKSFWPLVYEAGIDTIYEIRSVFEKLGNELDLEICNFIDSPLPLTLFSDLCEASFDYDARCAQLLNAGLTQQECQEQIDKEINDLKNKVAGLASLSFFDINPFSNSMPSMCGPDGAFVVPPGVEDTMERITDSLLDTIKGSLMVDMQGLKFFSTPPRAISAMKNPEELASAHEMMVKAVKDPYKKKCICYIADPTVYYEAASAESSTAAINSQIIYPFVYNRFIHYGNFSTFRVTGDLNIAGLTDGTIENIETLADVQAEQFATDNFNQKNEESESKVAKQLSSKLSWWRTRLTNHDAIYIQNQASNHAAVRESILSTIWAITGFIDAIDEAGTIFDSGLTHPAFFGYNQSWYDSVLDYNPLKILQDDYEKAVTDYENDYQTKYDEHYGELIEAALNDHFTLNNGENLKQGLLTDESFSLMHLTDDELNKDIEEYWTYKKHKPLDREITKIVPITIAQVLGGGEGSALAGDNSAAASLTDNVLEDMKKAVPSSNEQFVDDYMKQLLSRFYNDTEYDNSQIIEFVRSEFTKETKPIFLDKLILQPNQLFAPPGAAQGGLLNNKLVYNDLANNGRYTIGNSRNSFVGNINADSFSIPHIRREYSLDTKLKDIHPSCQYWYGMLRNYTGLDLGPFNNKLKHIPSFFLNMAMLDSFDAEDPESVFSSLQGAFSSDPGYFGFTLDPVDWAAEAASWFSYLLRDETNFTWYNWLLMSPGLRKLLPIILDRMQRDEDNSTKIFNDSGEIITQPSNVCLAFMELTLAEALGLEYDRIKKILPNISLPLQDAKVILGRQRKHPTAAVTKKAGQTMSDQGTRDIVDSYSGGGWTNASWSSFFPMFLVFEEHFRDPELPFNQGVQSMTDYFSQNKERVNEELYGVLQNIPNSVAGVSTFNEYNTESENLENMPNFNPNIVKYDLPFTEFSMKSGPGLDPNALMQDIMSAFSTIDATEQIEDIASTIQSRQLNRSLINQNVTTPAEGTKNTNITKQLRSIRNTSKLIKAAVSNNYPGHGDPWKESPKAINFDAQLSKEVYNFNFSEDLDHDVINLINTIFGKTLNSAELLDYVHNNSLKQEHLKDILNDVINNKSDTGIEQLHPSNFKAQIFGQLVTHKFEKKFMEIWDPDYVKKINGIPALNISNKNQVLKNLRQLYSTYGYSALQYAYSTQPFAKLKHSRLHERGFMKKMWKKIMKSPLVSEEDPRCRNLFDQMGIPNHEDLNSTETDFFNISEVKPKILEFYKNSLCKDVYEYNTEEENATRVSLIEGMIMVAAKIYSLEMCLASIIAWDSFVISDVFKEKAMIQIIIQNMLEDFDIEFLSFFANDLLRKEFNFTDIELEKIKKDQSSIEYIIKREVDNISSIVSNMFSNSSPMTTELNLDITKNSDPDFDIKYRDSYWPPNESAPFLSAEEYSFLFKEGGYEFVTDVRLKDNIYTMNYGDGEKEELTLGSGKNYELKCIQKSDLFGFGSRGKGNKNYFHSPPKDFYYNLEDSGDMTSACSTNSDLNSSPVQGDGKSAGYQIYNKNRGLDMSDTRYQSFLQHYGAFKQMAKADAFSKTVNPETLISNTLNQKLGNVIFQTYVKVVDYEPGEERDFTANHLIYIDSSGKPCDAASAQVAQSDINDFLQVISSAFNPVRDGNNPLNCYMFGVVPIEAWDYFLHEIFYKLLDDYTEIDSKTGAVWKPLRALYEQFGFKPFFKNISFGMRMVYCSSYPATESSVLDIHGFMDDNFSVTPNRNLSPNPLRKAKCLYGQRSGLTFNKSDGVLEAKLIRELQIPLVEIEKEIVFQENGNYFTVGQKQYNATEINTVSRNAVIFPAGNTKAEEYIHHKTYMRYITHNFQQFFYKNLASEFLQDIKRSAEFKLMFEYLFPVKRYSAMATILASDGLSRFIPEPTIVLEETKNSLKMIFDNLINSLDYEHTPSALTNFLADFAMRDQAGTGGKEPDITKYILRMLLRTPLMILKGFVEITDPAVMVAKAIIDISNAIIFSTISAIKQGITIAKQVVNSGIQAAEQVQLQIEMQITLGASFAEAAKNMLQPEGLKDAVEIDVTNKPSISQWNLAIVNENPEALDSATDDQKTAWSDFKKEFKELIKLKEDYEEITEKIAELKAEKQKIEENAEKKLEEIDELMKEVFQSPFLMPGMWAALMPPMIPFGGGIVPPPFPGGPFPSTVPGMIYIALLLIDAIEEKIHDDVQKLSNPENCEDEL